MKKTFTFYGFTLIEVIVAIGVFAVLSVMLSLLLAGTLRGSKRPQL